MKSSMSNQTISRLVYLRLEGKSLPEIANQLAREGFQTATGGGWYPSTVRQYLQLASKRLAASTADGGMRRKGRKKAA